MKWPTDSYTPGAKLTHTFPPHFSTLKKRLWELQVSQGQVNVKITRALSESSHEVRPFVRSLEPQSGVESWPITMRWLSLSLCAQAEVVVNYHVGETVLSLQKTTLIPGGSESLVYTTLSGGIGILVPFTSHEVKKLSCTNMHDREFFLWPLLNASVLFLRTMTSSSIWKCTCALSSPHCVAEIILVSGPTTSQSR